MKKTDNKKAKKSKSESSNILDTLSCVGPRNSTHPEVEDDSVMDSISQALSSAADSIGDFDIVEGVSKVAGDVVSGIGEVIGNIDL